MLFALRISFACAMPFIPQVGNGVPAFGTMMIRTCRDNNLAIFFFFLLTFLFFIFSGDRHTCRWLHIR